MLSCISKSGKNRFNELITLCAQHKLKVVEKDPLEISLRKSLNLGHTIGHALEKAMKLSHGEAVFWGMVAIDKLFQNQVMTDTLLLLAKDLGTDWAISPWERADFDLSALLLLIDKDKKRQGEESIDYISFKTIGQMRVCSIGLQKFVKKLYVLQGSER